MKRFGLPVLLVAAALLAHGLWTGAVPSAAAQRGRDQRGGRGGGRPAPPSRVLELVTTLKCTFPASASATWEDDGPRATANSAAPAFTLNVTSIDSQDGTAVIAGAGSSRDVTVKLAGSNLHILDSRPDGSLTITTVFAQESHDGRMKAVHSRVPEAAQYYGDCEIGPN